MIGNLDNFYGRTERLPDAMKLAEEYPYKIDGPLTESLAARIASAYAEHVWHAWEYPKNYDLVIWEYLEDDELDEIKPTEVFRIQIPVRFTPEFWDTEESTLDVPAPAAEATP